MLAAMLLCRLSLSAYNYLWIPLYRNEVKMLGPAVILECFCSKEGLCFKIREASWRICDPSVTYEDRLYAAGLISKKNIVV